MRSPALRRLESEREKALYQNVLPDFIMNDIVISEANYEAIK